MIDTPTKTTPRQRLTPIHQNQQNSNVIHSAGSTPDIFGPPTLNNLSTTASPTKRECRSLDGTFAEIQRISSSHSFMGSVTAERTTPSVSANRTAPGSGLGDVSSLADAELVRIPIDLSHPSPPAPQMMGGVQLSAKVLDALMWQGNLYLQIPTHCGAVGGSKEAFINLLDFAEEQLKARNVIVFFSKTRPERNNLMRLFMFLGFVALPPNHPLTPKGISAAHNPIFGSPSSSNDILYMAYNIC